MFLWLKLHTLFGSLRSTGLKPTSPDLQPGHGHRRKTDDRLTRRIVWMIIRKSRTTSKEIRGVNTKIKLHHYQITPPIAVRDKGGRHCWKQNPKNWLEFVKMLVDKPPNSWENIIWTHETKLELFGKTSMLTKTKHAKKRTPSSWADTMLW